MYCKGEASGWTDANIGGFTLLLCPSVFDEYRFDVLIRREATFLGGPEPAINPLKLLRGRAIFLAAQRRVDLKRNFGKLLLRLVRPGLNTPHRLFKRFRCHFVSIAYGVLDARGEGGAGRILSAALRPPLPAERRSVRETKSVAQQRAFASLGSHGPSGSRPPPG